MWYKVVICSSRVVKVGCCCIPRWQRQQMGSTSVHCNALLALPIQVFNTWIDGDALHTSHRCTHGRQPLEIIVSDENPVKQTSCFFSQVIFQKPFRISLGLPKRLFHLVCSAFAISTASYKIGQGEGCKQKLAKQAWKSGQDAQQKRFQGCFSCWKSYILEK